MKTVNIYCIWVFINLTLHSAISFGYGTEGHEIIARIADSLLSVTAKNKVNVLLNEGPNKNVPDISIIEIASWADKGGRSDPYQFTKKYHFYKSQYNLNSLCEKKKQLKCPESGCVMDAISYYALVLANEALPKLERKRALMYLVHFIGDIHQPLHLTERFRGGINAKVVFEGTTDLHRVWDSFMIKKRIAEDFKGNIEEYFKYFQVNLHSKGKWESKSLNWKNCRAKLGVCSIQWAYETQVWNCRGVWLGAEEGTDVATDYYQKFKVLDLPEEFLAKAGVRLANILENIFGKVNTVEAEQLPKYLENFPKRDREAKKSLEWEAKKPIAGSLPVKTIDNALNNRYQGLNDEQDETTEEQEESH